MSAPLVPALSGFHTTWLHHQKQELILRKINVTNVVWCVEVLRHCDGLSHHVMWIWGLERSLDMVTVMQRYFCVNKYASKINYKTFYIQLKCVS